MSGFCGCFFDRSQTRTPLEQMASVLREPELVMGAEGCHAALAPGLYPLHWSADGEGFAIVQGDPTWSDRKLARTAEAHGHAAALTEGTRARGKAVLNDIHGPFAIAVRAGGATFLAVDRLGIHTLSYGLREDVLAFGSSARCVARHPAFSPNLEAQALFHFLYFSEIPSPGTVYPDIRKLLPAECAELVDGRLQTGFYWEMLYVDRGAPPVSETSKQFRKLIRAAVQRLDTGPGTATFLSGGTDSSAVTGMLASATERPVHAYAMGFDVQGFDEMSYARIAARRYGVELHEYYVRPEDVAATLPVMAEAYDEPFGNESAISAYLLAQRARQDGISVLLAGDGGDELFGGNERYAKQLVFERYGAVPSWLRRGLIEPFAFGMPGGQHIWPVRKARSYIEQARVPLPERLEAYNHLHRSPLAEILTPEFLSGIDPEEPEALLREVYFRARSQHPVNRMLHLDLKLTLADNDLRKVSRMCEAAGVEVRYPLLDDALVEFSGELPPDYKVRGKQLRWLFKEALRDFLPQEILNKSKHGFGLPFGEWALTHPLLRDEVDRRVKDFAKRGILREDYLAEVRRRHAEEHATFYGTMLWKVCMLETWLASRGF